RQLFTAAKQATEEIASHGNVPSNPQPRPAAAPPNPESRTPFPTRRERSLRWPAPDRTVHRCPPRCGAGLPPTRRVLGQRRQLPAARAASDRARPCPLADRAPAV